MGHWNFISSRLCRGKLAREGAASWGLSGMFVFGKNRNFIAKILLGTTFAEYFVYLHPRHFPPRISYAYSKMIDRRIECI